MIHGDRWFIRTLEGEEVYSRGNDPDQRHNLAPGDPALPELRSLAQAAPGGGGLLTREPLDRDLERQLRSLGYLN